MTLNTAVAHRRMEPPKSLDYFPTPPWATRAFVQHVALPVLGFVATTTVWEPACGEGHMAAVLTDHFDVYASDAFNYGYGPVGDFLMLDMQPPVRPDWIVTNPPFNRGIDFARLALNVASQGVCLLVRPQWLHSVGRFRLFEEAPPTLVAWYAERVPMHRGRWEPDGSTLTDYCWVCWRHGAPRLPPMWIPPGRRVALTKRDDVARFAVRGVA